MKKTNWNELFRYGVVGVATTLVNYFIFVLCLFINENMYLLANTFAWIGAVIFAYYTNKKYVFKKEGRNQKEMLSFIMMRFLTLFMENILLFLFIQMMSVSVLLAKVLVSVITVISNYGVCKWKIFNTKGENNNGKN